MEKLPILISTPHCSGEVPQWILDLMLQTGESEPDLRRRLFKEGDPYTDLLFRIPSAEMVLNATASRFVADLNRGRDEDGDNGVIKLTDFERRPFYSAGYSVTPRDREWRLAHYYDPFHAQMEKALGAGRSGGIRFFIDGHSMMSRGPALGPDMGQPRPALCVGNFGDTHGEPVSGSVFSPAGAVSCPPDQARWIRDELARLLADPIADSGLAQGVSLNDPFDGGHILRKYSSPPYSVPGVMIEVNRALYLDEATLLPLPGRIDILAAALGRLAEAISASPRSY